MAIFITWCVIDKELQLFCRKTASKLNCRKQRVMDLYRVIADGMKYCRLCFSVIFARGSGCLAILQQKPFDISFYRSRCIY